MLISLTVHRTHRSNHDVVSDTIPFHRSSNIKTKLLWCLLEAVLINITISRQHAHTIVYSYHTVKKAEIRNVWCHQQAYMTMKFWWLWMGQDFHDLKQSPWPRNLRGTIQKIHVSKVLDPQTWKSMISAFQNTKHFHKTHLDDKVMMLFSLSCAKSCWPKIWQWYTHSLEGPPN